MENLEPAFVGLLDFRSGVFVRRDMAVIVGRPGAVMGIDPKVKTSNHIAPADSYVFSVDLLESITCLLK